MDEHIHIEIKEGAVATFTKMPSKETLNMIRKLVDKAEKVVNKNSVLSDVSRQLPPNPITDKEWKNLMKALYPKDRGNNNRR